MLRLRDTVEEEGLGLFSGSKIRIAVAGGRLNLMDFLGESSSDSSFTGSTVPARRDSSDKFDMRMTLDRLCPFLLGDVRPESGVLLVFIASCGDHLKGLCSELPVVSCD